MSTSDQDSALKNRALLPAGLRDVLPPDAAHEAATVEALIACFETYGYDRVKPPLVEFENSLFSGPGEAMTDSTFRVMDPVSQRMMGLRADVTVQVARIAATRLRHVPRPLRLCYAGEVLRVVPGELNPERGLVQVGAELVGTDTVEADAEVILMAVEGLRRIGSERLSVDITAPRLVLELLQSLGIDQAQQSPLRTAIDRKDSAAVAASAGEHAQLLTDLMAAAGSWERGLGRIDAIDLPGSVSGVVARLGAVAKVVAQAEPEIEVTIDPVENRGFEYYTGLGFSLLSRGVRGELGRGGRYQVDGLDSEGSCGLTLYMETVLRAIPEAKPGQRVFVPVMSGPQTGKKLRQEGWSTLCGLEPVSDPVAEAVRLGCSHVFLDAAVRPVEGEDT